MTKQLVCLSTAELNDLVLALQSGRITPTYTDVSLRRILSDESTAKAAAGLESMAAAGMSPQQIAVALNLISIDRAKRPGLEDVLELVTTGPELQGIANRDTSVVVRDLFANATESVLIAGFAIYQGQRVFQALADRMLELPELKVRICVDIQRPMGDTTMDLELVRRFASRFRTEQWPQDRPSPTVVFDPRSLDTRNTSRACMHAKCVVIDSREVFVTSANLTEAAQLRNIEVGVLIHSRLIAVRLIEFFDSLQHQGHLVQVPSNSL